MDFQSIRLLRLISRGLDQCHELREPVLISYSLPLEKYIDPVTFFLRAEAMNSEKVTYWSEPNQSSVFVGIGAALSTVVQDAHSQRFIETEEKWRNIVNHCLQDALEDVLRAGPVLMGGFSFDPLKPNMSKRWRRFAHADFHVPQWLLTTRDGRAWLTANFLLQGNEEPEVLTSAIIERGEQLIGPEGEVDTPFLAASMVRGKADPQAWMNIVKLATERIRHGEVGKVVLARDLVLHNTREVSVAAVIRALHREQADSYIFSFGRQGDYLVGASPERIIKRKGEAYYSTCLAGSIPRGKTLEEDEELGQQLLQDEKNLMEHNFVVQLNRSILGKHCETIAVAEKPVLMRLRNIQHLYTPIVGKGKTESSLLAVLGDLHPTPALGGFPKAAALEQIRCLEPLDRGWYGGPVGWIDSRGDGEFVVAIRCGLVQGKTVSLFAGGGIVEGSDPQSEYEETAIKMQPMLSALEGM
ncbi:MAG: isochorismate synthase family protein [Firmicutes bacterium]|nr:isochorismate synthase family protein [Bacillota bacterium]